MDDSSYVLKCRSLERQLETITRALRDAQEALDSERAMRAYEQHEFKKREDELLEEQQELEEKIFALEGESDA